MSEPVESLVDNATRLALHCHVVDALVADQREATDRARSLATQIRATAEDVAAAAQESAAAAASGHRSAAEGDESVRALLEQLSSTAEVAAATAEELGELLVRVRRIADVADAIDRLAGQTKLLSLNATIEAARSKEEGAGFRVVAEEMGRLANASAEAVTTVRTIMQDAAGQAERAATAGAEIHASAAEAIERGRHAGGRFSDIAAQTAQLESMATNVAAAAEQQLASAGTLDTMADDLAVAATAAVTSTGILTGTVLDIERGAGHLGALATVTQRGLDARVAMALTSLHGALTPVLDVPRRIAGHLQALAGRRADDGGQLAAASLGELDPVMRDCLRRSGGALHNVSVAMAPGRVAGRRLLMRAWGAAGPDAVNITPNTDPGEPDFYNYEREAWFTSAIARGGPMVSDPFHDVTVDTVIVTATFLAVDEAGVLAVAGADLDLAGLRRLCAPALAGLPTAAVITETGVVIAANDDGRFRPGESADPDDGVQVLDTPALAWRLALTR